MGSVITMFIKMSWYFNSPPHSTTVKGKGRGVEWVAGFLSSPSGLKTTTQEEKLHSSSQFVLNPLLSTNQPKPQCFLHLQNYTISTNKWIQEVLSGKLLIFPQYICSYSVGISYCHLSYLLECCTKALEKFFQKGTIYSLIPILYFCHFCVTFAVQMEVFMPQFLSSSGNFSNLLYCYWTLWSPFASYSCDLAFHFTQVLFADTTKLYIY